MFTFTALLGMGDKKVLGLVIESQVHLMNFKKFNKKFNLILFYFKNTFKK